MEVVCPETARTRRRRRDVGIGIEDPGHTPANEVNPASIERIESKISSYSPYQRGSGSILMLASSYDAGNKQAMFGFVGRFE